MSDMHHSCYLASARHLLATKRASRNASVIPPLGAPDFTFRFTLAFVSLRQGDGKSSLAKIKNPSMVNIVEVAAGPMTPRSRRGLVALRFTA
jgi:hypothetical protein